MTAREKVGQVEHLHPGRDRSRRAGQAAAAARAARRLDRLPMVGGGHRGQAAAAMPRLPTLLAREPGPGPAPPRLAAPRCRRLALGPAGRPARLAAFALAFAAGPSVLGGCEEFEESRPTCRRNASNSTRNASINTACSAMPHSRQLRIRGRRRRLGHGRSQT